MKEELKFLSFFTPLSQCELHYGARGAPGTHTLHFYAKPEVQDTVG